MDTVIEAYEFTLSKIKDLEETGIMVTFKPTNSRNDKEIVEKYNLPDRLPPELWYNVKFTIIDPSDSNKIFELGNYLRLCGIGFDTGGCCGIRDWELDWSFTYKKGDDQPELGMAREELEEMINSLSWSEKHCDLEMKVGGEEMTQDNLKKRVKKIQKEKKPKK